MKTSFRRGQWLLALDMSAKRKQREGGTRCSFPGRVPGIRRRRRVMFLPFSPVDTKSVIGGSQDY
jgi:hypothetical protein